MKIRISVLFWILFSGALFAQNTDKSLNDRIIKLEAENAELRNEVRTTRNSINFLSEEFDRHLYTYDELRGNSNIDKSLIDQSMKMLEEQVTEFQKKNTELNKRLERYILCLAIGLAVIIASIVVLVILIRKAKKNLKYAMFYRIVIEADQLKNDVYKIVGQSSEDMKYLFYTDLHNVNDTMTNEFTSTKESLIAEIETISKDMRDDLMHISGSLKQRIESEVTELLARIEKLEKDVKKFTKS